MQSDKTVGVLVFGEMLKYAYGCFWSNYATYLMCAQKLHLCLMIGRMLFLLPIQRKVSKNECKLYRKDKFVKPAWEDTG